MIFVNNLKKDLKNDNEKAGIPSFLPPKPATSYVDDLDFFKDFENEFPTIVYNDARTSKSDYLTKQTLSPRHNNESDFNDETSLSEYDVVGQNILYFNDLFPFNVIYPNDLKSDEDNDNNEIYIIQSLGGMPELKRDGLFAKMVKEHRDDAGVVVFNSRAWGRLFDIRGPLVWELILEFHSAVRFREVLLDLDAPARYLRRFAAGRKSRAHISSGQFIARLAEHFGLLTTKILRGLTVIAPELTIIDMGELDAPIIDEGGQANLAPVQAPPPPPAAARTMPQRMARLEEDVHEICGAITEQREVIEAMARDFSRNVKSDRGLARPAPPQHSKTYSSQTHDPPILIFLVMEYLVNIRKRRTFWSLNKDILKITILKTNTPYPLRKIRHIRACTYQRPQRNEAQYAVSRETYYAVFKISERYNLAYFIAKCMELVTKQPRLIMPYGMLLTRFLKHVMTISHGVLDDYYDLHDRVMYPLIDQQEQKTRKDYGTKRGCHSTSSSSALGQPSSSHLNNDDDDGNNEGTSSASTLSPTRFVNSLTNEVPRVFENPPNFNLNMEPSTPAKPKY
ncbi:hypothetical protein Tco_0046716 [Tanacetum coccineum]